MPEGVFLGFDFGMKRIGVAVGQNLTLSASPLPTLSAKQGVPSWDLIQKLILQWKPEALIVGLPKSIDDSELYTTKASLSFGRKLQKRFSLPVHMVDERLTTKEARSQIFNQGGFKRLKKTELDSIAACLILEQWLQST